MPKHAGSVLLRRAGVLLLLLLLLHLLELFLFLDLVHAMDEDECHGVVLLDGLAVDEGLAL